MTLLEQYKKKKFDLAPFGIERGEMRSTYFCTPVGARIFGWTGVDGIHYCTVRGFGETVFAVSPMNSPGEYVHPVARDFSDFLRLLLAVGEEAALEQTYRWSKEQFDTYCRENPPTDEQRAAIARLLEQTGLLPMEDPYGYVRAVQSAFDSRLLRFGPDYEEWAPPEPRVPAAPEWEVYFDGSFFHRGGRARPGEVITLNRTFPWGETQVYVPAVYTCSAGLVLDLCFSAAAAEMTAFMRRWNLVHPEQEHDGETEGQILADHPLERDFRAQAAVNGALLRQSGGCSTVYIPASVTGEEPPLESRWVIEHYALDPAEAWCVHRVRFPWATRRKPKLRSLSVTLIAAPVSVPGIRFTTPTDAPIVFVHPRTGVTHTLTVEQCIPSELGHRSFTYDGAEMPAHYVSVLYRLSPDLPDSELSIRDCEKNAEPRKKPGMLPPPDVSGSTDIGIIGGADGPTAILFGASAKAMNSAREQGLHIACSSLRFDAPETVMWRMIFREKMREDVTASLMEK